MSSRTYMKFYDAIPAKVDPGIAQDRLQSLLQSLGQQLLAEDQARQMSEYLGLLLRWNAKINLTAHRDEESILKRNFIESILCARLLPRNVITLLDYGSGGGFPGVPCAVCCPTVHVTLAESQAKKAAFLREAVRTLKLNAAVYDGRVEDMAAGLLFDVVTLRAVDRMQEACAAALLRVKVGGWLAVLTTQGNLSATIGGLSTVLWSAPTQLVGTDQQILLQGRRLAT